MLRCETGSGKKYTRLRERRNLPVYTYGPIIHNEEVVEDLEKRGVSVLNSEEELLALTRGNCHHPFPRGAEKDLPASQGKGTGLCGCDLPLCAEDTQDRGARKPCGTSYRHNREQRPPGSGGNPRLVRRTLHCDKNQGRSSRNFLREGHENVCIVSQTTFNYKNFQELVEILAKKRYDRLVLNTICNATNERQAEAAEIAKTVDAMIVIGGKHSSNTQKLFEICKGVCKNTYFIQTLADLDSDSFRSIQCVGITAGASTPNKIIEEVSKHVRIKF